MSHEVAPGFYSAPRVTRSVTRSMSVQRQPTVGEEEADDDDGFEKQPEPALVLLTGASGLLGVFMLDMLLRQARRARVICLVRDGQGGAGASQRLRAT
jgi:hypothetical protein